jgi:hypothetical protein
MQTFGGTSRGRRDPPPPLAILTTQILNFLVLGIEDKDSSTFIRLLLSDIPNAQVSPIPPAMSLVTIAVEFGEEILTIHLTSVCSTARLACSSPFGLDQADGLIFVTSSPTLANVQVMTRWLKEIRLPSRQIPAFFVIQPDLRVKQEEKLLNREQIMANDFNEVYRPIVGRAGEAEKIVMLLLAEVMERGQNCRLHTAALKEPTRFGNLF